MPVTNIQLITPGVVRNLQKTTYYLRVLQDRKRADRSGKTVPILPNQDVEIDYRDWILIEDELIIRDNLKILKIIKYPAIAPQGGLIVINNPGQLPDPLPGMIIWVQYGDYQGIYYYDEERGEWLSENESLVTWSSTTDTTAHTVSLVSNSNDTHQDNDSENITPITITALAASQANPILAGEATRFSINSYDLSSGVITPSVAFIDLSTIGERGVSSTSLNFPVNGNTVLSASRIKVSGTDKITRPALTLWYRKRLI